MAKVTSKLQVTLPKAIAIQYHIRPGDEIEWIPAGEGIRVQKRQRRAAALDVARRRELFDQATQRQRRRQRQQGRPVTEAAERGWRRDQLYVRGSTR